MRIAAITGGANVPSRRYRIDALKPHLAACGIDLTEFCPKTTAYPPEAALLRPAWLAAALAERLTYCWRASGFDAVVLQRELISTLPTIEGIIPGPKIFDVDDAIYLYRGGIAARHCARVCDLIVCGNDLLADHFSQWNNKIEVIPTGVDTERLVPLPIEYPHRKPIVGWIGTSANLRFIEPVAHHIAAALARVDGAAFEVVSNSTEGIPRALRPYLQFTRWRPGIENDLLPGWAVGIMPLADDEWARGKCAFKLLQYLAAGIPVVASPVGVNATILNAGSFGYAARSGCEWSESLTYLLTNHEFARNAGRRGREFVEAHYSLGVLANHWANVLTNLLG